MVIYRTADTAAVLGPHPLSLPLLGNVGGYRTGLRPHTRPPPVPPPPLPPLFGLKCFYQHVLLGYYIPPLFGLKAFTNRV